MYNYEIIKGSTYCKKSQIHVTTQIGYFFYHNSRNLKQNHKNTQIRQNFSKHLVASKLATQVFKSFPEKNI